MIRRPAVMIALAACLLAGVALAQKSQPRAGSPLQGLPGTAFEWGKAPGFSERGSIIVPISLGDATYNYQLDTGTYVTIVYGGETAKRFGWTPGQTMVHVPSIGVGGITLPAANVRVAASSQGGGIAGTIGLDVLIGRVVVLDFPARRIYILLRADLPAAVRRRISWTPAKIRGGKFFVHAKLDGADCDGLFLDTGSSAFPLVVDADHWKTLTRPTYGEHPAREVSVNSWGKQVKLVGQPALGAIEIASLRVDHPLIFYPPGDALGLQKQPHAVSGLLGNALFWDDILVLDFGAPPQLGILR
jgi:hypothetical protein